MSKHTPGPWYWDFDRDGKASLRSDAVGEPIMNDGKYPSIEDRCLIAAAPDLLEALDGLLDRYTNLVDCGDCGYWNAEAEEEVIASRAAIAKARGAE